MRYIKISEIEQKLTTEQKDKLSNASKEVEDVEENYLEENEILAENLTKHHKCEIKKRRTEIINKNSILWSNLKTIYEDHFYKKCWYTESNNPGSSKDMDHFRPKNEVKEDKNHPGYWWLAFDWENYRYCCQFSNRPKKNPKTSISGGKGIHFPLFDYSPRAQTPNEDIKDEIPLLLDPCSGGDYKLLSFNIEGKPIVNPKFENDADECERVSTSIRHLNIDYPDFNEQRADLYYKIREIVKKADRAFKKFQKDKIKNFSFHAVFTDYIKELFDIKKKNKEYSWAAEIYIKKFRENEWIDKYFTD